MTQAGISILVQVGGDTGYTMKIYFLLNPYLLLGIHQAKLVCRNHEQESVLPTSVNIQTLIR